MASHLFNIKLWPESNFLSLSPQPMLIYCQLHPWGHFREIRMEIHVLWFSMTKMYLKMSSAKFHPFYSGLNESNVSGKDNVLGNISGIRISSNCFKVLNLDSFHKKFWRFKFYFVPSHFIYLSMKRIMGWVKSSICIELPDLTSHKVRFHMVTDSVMSEKH